MKEIIWFAFFLFSSTSISQDEVSWSFSYDATNHELELKATLADGWHLYSQTQDSPYGPVPTSFAYEKNKSVKLVGDTDEPQPIEKYDPNFEQEVNFFEEEVTFIQKVKVKKRAALKGVVTYMLCNDSMCLPPVDEEFEIEVKK